MKVRLLSLSVSTRLVGHISRDSTKIEAREKPEMTAPEKPSLKRKPGRPKKGEELLAKEPTRLKRQSTMTLEEMLADLPKACDIDTKQNIMWLPIFLFHIV